ncbi:MAG: LacI family DNA-binding transcriptional regulator [Ferruginibacter sp.]
MKKKLSIHDIARELKVSATSISFVLNGAVAGKKVSEPVRKKILDYVESIGYKPNLIAQTLRTGKSKIIAMLVEDISDPFFSSIGRIIEDNLYKIGYKIFHSSTNNNTARAKDLLRMFRDRHVDGYIIAPSPGIESDIQHLMNTEGKPVVLFDRFFPDLETINVVIDNEGGAYTAAKHLVENGFSNVAFVTLHSDQNQMSGRLQGYMKAMYESGRRQFVLKLPYNTDPKELTKLIRSFIETNREINAVLFATNYLTVSGLKAISELNLKIPADIGVVGFDDNTHFALFSPSITAVAQPLKDIAMQIVQQLAKALDEQERKRKTTILPAELIVRESSVLPYAIDKTYPYLLKTRTTNQNR